MERRWQTISESLATVRMETSGSSGGMKQDAPAFCIKANVPSGGMETHYEIGAFLARPHTPEAQDLLILIGALVGGADEFRGVRRDDEARL